MRGGTSKGQVRSRGKGLWMGRVMMGRQRNQISLSLKMRARELRCARKRWRHFCRSRRKFGPPLSFPIFTFMMDGTSLCACQRLRDNMTTKNRVEEGFNRADVEVCWGDSKIAEKEENRKRDYMFGLSPFFLR